MSIESVVIGRDADVLEMKSGRLEGGNFAVIAIAVYGWLQRRGKAVSYYHKIARAPAKHSRIYSSKKRLTLPVAEMVPAVTPSGSEAAVLSEATTAEELNCSA